MSIPDPAVALACGNPDHKRPVAAIARLFWPAGQHRPTTACRTDLPSLIRDSLEDGYAVEVWPAVREPANPLRWGQWRKAPDCGRCDDAGRFRETANRITVEAHCSCRRGRRMSELWYDVRLRAVGRTLTLLAAADREAYAAGYDAGVSATAAAVGQAIEEARDLRPALQQGEDENHG